MIFSVKNKLFSLFTVIISISVVSVAWFGYSYAKVAYENEIFATNLTKIKELSNSITALMENVPDNLRYHADFYALHKLLVWEDLQDKQKVAYWKDIYVSSLKDFIYKKEFYYQVKVLDTKGDEKFLLKYNGRTQDVIELKNEKLINQSHQEYFQKALQLKKGDFYISQMGLNSEANKIIKPFIPVVRYATPIINENGETKGVVVLSFEATKLLSRIDKEQKNDKIGGKYYLIDPSGGYLYHENESKQWADVLETGFNFYNDYTNIYENFQDKEEVIITQKDQIFFMSKIYPNIQEDKNRFWYLVYVQNTDIAFASLEKFTQTFLVTLLLVLILGLFLINLYIAKLINPLRKVTTQLKMLSAGEIQKSKIEYHSNDEISAIVDSTRILVDAIENTINQANSIAQGNLTHKIELLGKNDRLGHALQDMTKRLQEIATLAHKVSVGNYHVDIFTKSSEDEIGLALEGMVEYLKKITAVAESISVGNLDVNYKAQGEDDRLGLAILEMLHYLRTILNQAKAISNGDYTEKITAKSHNDELGIALKEMANILQVNSTNNREDAYFSKGTTLFIDLLSGISDITKLTNAAIVEICRYTDASCGVFFMLNENENALYIASTFAIEEQELKVSIPLGKGIIGQVALDKEPLHLKERNEKIQTLTATLEQKEIYIFPIVFDNNLLGVIELMSLSKFREVDIKYFLKVGEIFATELFTLEQNEKIKELLQKSQAAFEELQIQSEEIQETNVEMQEQQQQLTSQANELKEKNKKLRQAKEEIDLRAKALEEASRYKSEFLANMSHELRTPLNSIILLSKLMSANSDKKLDGENVKKLSVINRAGNDLLLLINDILDLTKIESGKMELTFTQITSQEFLNNLHDLFDTLAQEKKIDFIIIDNFNGTFTTDEGKLAQILKNLLSNAFKFTKSGSVSLEITSKDNELEISVSDTGIGIAKENLELIFEAFKQVDGSISREFGGTGLGLSISKTLVELFKGRIEVQSELTKGTSFKVILPLLVQNEELHNEVNITKSNDIQEQIQKPLDMPISTPIINVDTFTKEKYKLHGKNILIVDDDSRNIFTLSAFIETLDGEVYSAFNGQEALEVLEKEDIDLILMDVMMPVMDGLKAIKSIRAITKYQDIPIIAITAKTMEQDKQDCIAAGANDYMPKPIEHDALLLMIKAWIQ